MKRLIALALALFAATQADGQGSASACWLGATWTTCFKPVVHTSMEGPASATVSGYLSSTDWSAFNSGGAAGVPATRTISTTAPLTGGGNLSADRTFAITQAATAANGYLTSTDWNTFNSKVGTATAINTTAPLAGGGDLSTSRTLSITQAATAANGYLSSTDWNTFNAKQATISITAPITLTGATVGITQAATAANGYLSSTDWNTFNGKGAAYTQGNLTEATSSVLTFTNGTNAVFGSGTTIAVTKSDSTHNGYLGSTDWATFNNKVSTTRAINTTAPITGGGDLSADRTIAISAASNSTAGSVSYEDSGTFSATFTGPFNSGAQTIQYARVGKIVTLMIPSITGTCTSASVMTASTVVPAGLQPAVLVVIPVGIGNNGSQVTSPLGILQISTGGTITVYRDNNGSTFTNASNSCGLTPGQSSPYTLVSYVHS